MKSNRKNNKQNDNLSNQKKDLNGQSEVSNDKYKLPENGFEIKVEPLQILPDLDVLSNLGNEAEELDDDLSNEVIDEQLIDESYLKDIHEVDNQIEELDSSQEQDNHAQSEEKREISQVVDSIKLSRVDEDTESDDESPDMTGDNSQEQNSNTDPDENDELDDSKTRKDSSKLKENEKEQESKKTQGKIATEATKQDLAEDSDEDTNENSDENFSNEKKQNSNEDLESHPDLFLDEGRKIDLKKSTKSAFKKINNGSKILTKNLKQTWQNKKIAKANFEAALNPVEKEKLNRRKAAGNLILFATIIAIVLNIVWAKIPVESLNLSRYNLDGVFFKNLLNILFAMLIPSAVIFNIFSLKQVQIFGGTKQNSTAYVLTALMGIPLALAVTGLHNLTIFVLDKLSINVTFKNHYAINESPSFIGFILMLAVLVIVPAVVEEFMFRGVLQTSLRSSERLHLSFLLTATASSLFFRNIMFVVVYLAIALVLSYVKEAADNIFIPIVLHISISASLLIMQYFLPLYNSAIDLKSIDGRSKFYISLILAVVALVLLIPIFKACFSAYADSRENNNSELDTDTSLELREELAPVDWKYILAILLLVVSSAMV